MTNEDIYKIFDVSSTDELARKMTKTLTEDIVSHLTAR